MNKISLFKPLSDQFIKRITPNLSNVITYRDILRYNDIDSLLGKYKAIIILYENKKLYGHYTCLFEYDDVIYFFDSYGILPDDEFLYIPKEGKLLAKCLNHLTKLLYESGKEIDYNNYVFQNEKYSTCGMHCICRLNHRYLDSDQYADLIFNICKRDDINPDQLVFQYIKSLI